MHQVFFESVILSLQKYIFRSFIIADNILLYCLVSTWSNANRLMLLAATAEWSGFFYDQCKPCYNHLSLNMDFENWCIISLPTADPLFLAIPWQIVTCTLHTLVETNISAHVEPFSQVHECCWSTNQPATNRCSTVLNWVDTSNNDTNVNVYGAVIMVRPLREFTRFIQWM